MVGDEHEASPEKIETQEIVTLRNYVRPTIEIMTNLLFEALQQVNIIPNMLA